MSCWAGSKVRLHQPGGWAEGGMTASGTPHVIRLAPLTRAKQSYVGHRQRTESYPQPTLADARFCSAAISHHWIPKQDSEQFRFVPRTLRPDSETLLLRRQ